MAAPGRCGTSCRSKRRTAGRAGTPSPAVAGRAAGLRSGPRAGRGRFGRLRIGRGGAMSCGNPHETPCTEVLDRVYGYLDGELGDLDCAKIRQHLDECGPCLREYGLEEAVKRVVQKPCGCDPAPAELRAKILVRIREVRATIEFAE